MVLSVPSYPFWSIWLFEHKEPRNIGPMLLVAELFSSPDSTCLLGWFSFPGVTCFSSMHATSAPPSRLCASGKAEAEAVTLPLDSKLASGCKGVFDATLLVRWCIGCMHGDSTELLGTLLVSWASCMYLMHGDGAALLLPVLHSARFLNTCGGPRVGTSSRFEGSQGFALSCMQPVGAVADDALGEAAAAAAAGTSPSHVLEATCDTLLLSWDPGRDKLAPITGRVPVSAVHASECCRSGCIGG